MPSPTLRIARPTTNLPAITAFYTNSLGLQVIASFANHNGYDGVMLGHPECSAWHLEFTFQHDNGNTTEPSASPPSAHKPLPPPTDENLLVFYLPDKVEWEATVQRVEIAGGKRVKSGNPWWEVCGATFEDPDGWRVVLQNAAWR